MNKNMWKKLFLPVTIGGGATGLLTLKLGIQGFLIGIGIALLTGTIFRLKFGKAS